MAGRPADQGKGKSAKIAISGWTLSDGCGNQGLKQFSGGSILLPKPFRMPLNRDYEIAVGGFQGFDDAVGGDGADRQAGCRPVHRLVVLAVDPQA